MEKCPEARCLHIQQEGTVLLIIRKQKWVDGEMVKSKYNFLSHIVIDLLRTSYFKRAFVSVR